MVLVIDGPEQAGLGWAEVMDDVAEPWNKIII